MVVIKGQGTGCHPVRVDMSFMPRNSERAIDQSRTEVGLQKA